MVIELCDGGSITEEVVPGLVRTFGCRWLEDPYLCLGDLKIVSGVSRKMGHCYLPTTSVPCVCWPLLSAATAGPVAAAGFPVSATIGAMEIILSASAATPAN